MGRIPEETIQLLRDRVDIVDLVGRFVTLRKAGRSYKGLCPFHDEKTPSFSVNPDRQSFHCFGCLEGGNAFSFLMKMENLTFPEAARALAREHGVQIPEEDAGERGLTERLQQVTELAQKRFRAALAERGNPGAAYLASRGIDADTIARFGIGWAPAGWDFLEGALRQAGVPPELGERAGLLARRDSGGHYDRLRARVTFPIQDVRGRVIAFGGRAVRPDDEPKYLNTPESPLFRKRRAFFGFPRSLEPMRRTGRAVVVEGYFDLVALHRAGVEGGVATCGTALTEEHARELRRRTRQLVLLFDGDEAGQRAVERALELLLPEGLRVRAAVLPPGDDPDSFLAREGPDALRALVDEAPVALEVAIRRAVARGCATPWEKADAVAAVAPLLARVPSPVERGELCAQLALAAGTEPAHVAAAVRDVARGGDARVVPMAPRREGPEERALERLARSLTEHPQLAARVPRDALASLAPPGPQLDVVLALVDAAAVGDGRCDLVALAEGLEGEARTRLQALGAEDWGLALEDAARIVDDTLGWLARRQKRERQKEITRKLREPDADVADLLRQKDALNRPQESPELQPPPPMRP